ncbi:MAG TPA: glutamine-hydrolyzing carbamoyl-phosphate synthase small subunit [Candidatus Eisenbacteria bacterium]|nr:glutamine-hydrolyzing carbamoyl-phosphate synthase small subunit [Candidatus Eisenbacteria bacterium]
MSAAVRLKHEAILALEDGRVFRGRRLGAEGEAYGEVVFNTSMTGYQEILSDPSYAGQIVTLTYPLIGNYGVRADFFESRRLFAEALVVREAAEFPSPWRSEGRLAEFLEERGVVAIEGIDTRALTRHIREKGELKAVLSTTDLDDKRLVAKARASAGLLGRNLAAEVTCKEPYRWTPEGAEAAAPAPAAPPSGPRRARVVVYDFGVKRGILRSLAGLGLEVVVVPAATPVERALAYSPVGVVLSNGPGDPAATPEAVAAAQGVIGKLPVLGICLGHQVSGLALGAKTNKLKFGHHGANHPVMNVPANKVEITSQNHGFVVDPSGLPRGAQVTHRSLNDGACEGLAMPEKHLICVQFHPEASPGPHDSHTLFQDFSRLCGLSAERRREAPIEAGAGAPGEDS